MDGVTSKCKVYVESVTKTSRAYEIVNFRGVAADELPENQRFNNASPSIEMKIGIANTRLHGTFVPGDQYYVDFTPATKPE